MIEKTLNKYGRMIYSGVTNETPLTELSFSEVLWGLPGYKQIALLTNLGRLTVVDRETGYGGGVRDTETGFHDMEGGFWLASGMLDVRSSEAVTFGEAVTWVKARANTCNPDRKEADDAAD